MEIAIVSGSPRKLSKTIHVMSHVHDYLNNKSYHLDLIDLADVWIIGTPIYNSFLAAP
jgi:NAD(P)H-dependent FMN reductase